MKHEAVIARSRLAFRAGEGVLLVRFRMQEYREILADTTIPERLEFFRHGAHDTPVPLPWRDAELRVADRATYEINLHRVIVPEWLA